MVISRRAFAAALGAPPAPDPPLERFFAAAAETGRAAEGAAQEIARRWRNGFAAMILEMDYLIARRNPNPEVAHDRLVRLLEAKTGQRWGGDLHAWQRWIWSQPYAPHPDYADFKGQLYATIDPRMRGFFPPGVKSRIRLDQVQWGGVMLNGIPPLEHPKLLPAAEASYLKDSNAVFGVEIQGEARAYPKRILAWHEMAIDRVGGLDLCLVYCTLCGTVIPYRAGPHRFGTSGLLFESSKLMFDHDTGSLWSTLEGSPVIGPLVDKGIQLELEPVVTTTWGEWRAAHPETKVLSLETGHRRDYGEGVAYRDYFASPDLMFRVSKEDTRLRAKDEVLLIRGADGRPRLAVSAKLLASQRVFHAGDWVILTSDRGANRVYAAGGRRFSAEADPGWLRDSAGQRWRVEEFALVAGGERLERAAAHRAFWFGVYAQFPNLKLLNR